MTGGGPPSAVAKSIGSIPTSPSWRFQYVHIGRSRTRSPEGVLTSIVSGIPSIAQNRFAHGPGAMTTCSPTSIRPADVSTAVIEPSGASSKPCDLDPGEDGDPDLGALALEPPDRVHVEGEAALVLVQARRHALRAPVGEEPLHVLVDLGLAQDQLRAVADPLLPLVRRRQVGLLHRRPERDVADRVVRVRLRVGLPDLDAGLHQLAHRGLEVVVANDAAGDSGRAGAGVRLVEDEDVGAGAGAARRELLRQVVRGREAVDPGADDDVRAAGGNVSYCS